MTTQPSRSIPRLSSGMTRWIFAVFSTAATCFAAETGRLTEPALVELRHGDRSIGSTTLPEGTLIRIPIRKDNRAYVETRIGAIWIPANHVKVTNEPLNLDVTPMPLIGNPQSYRPDPNQFRKTPMRNSAPSELARSQKVPARPTEHENIPSSNSIFERSVIDLTKQARQAEGLPALQLSEPLAKAARFHAAHMAQHSYFDHNTHLLDGQQMTPAQRIGLFDNMYAGENIANGQQSPKDVMRSWMNSPGHRANILRKEHTRIGVGYVAGYWVQVFGR